MTRKLRLVIWALGILAVALIPGSAFASGFGEGVFGANVPFGSMTSISINLGGDVSLPLSAAGSTFSGSASHTVTVTSTDVVGYTLYVHPTSSTSMTMPGSSAFIPASTNSTPLPLATGSWGYNTTGSTTNFLGMTAAGAVIKDAIGPYKNGDPTTITYGALTSTTQAAGNYSVAVTYTVVAKNP